MLRSLSIRDVVLIDRLDLEFSSGLSVLTGETGAGKSILLDALGLALGQRADARLVRSGQEKASVTCAFELPASHLALGLLTENGLDEGDDGLVIVRRVVGQDGRSRAFINDQAASIGLLKAFGETLVEIHGQFENQSLLQPSAHLALLDSYGGLGDDVRSVSDAWTAWVEAGNACKQAAEVLAQAREDEEYLRHAMDELDQASPEAGEEKTLAEKRQIMMHGEKLMEALNNAVAALGGNKGVERKLRDSMRYLEGVRDKAEGRFDEALGVIDRGSETIAQALDLLGRAGRDIDLDPRHLEEVEGRLFSLRALSRKHGVTVDALAAFRDELAAKLEGIDGGGAELIRLKEAEAQARKTFEAGAHALSDGRKKAAKKLGAAVMAELPPLKMEKARFEVLVETVDEEAWSRTGIDRGAFQVATNPGSAAGPLGKIASGGELARFMLALKVVLAKADPVPTLVFDEVDAGIGGAVADAVGERLQRLGSDVQVLVVTHSPQVAARGTTHMRVKKKAGAKSTQTSIETLLDEARMEEIARMLAGQKVTDEARAAAGRLLSGQG